MNPQRKTETISVTVKRVLYPKINLELAENCVEQNPVWNESEWYILDTNIGIAKGNLTWRPGTSERLQITGYWSEYQGKIEFKFTEAMADIPTDERDILTYACELTPHIGPAIEAKIWDAREDDWRNITIDEVPELEARERLVNLQKAIEKIDNEKEKTQAIGFVMAHKGTLKLAGYAWEEWKTATIKTISDNPYRLSDLPHYGFIHVDTAIRQTFGIVDDDARRIRSGIEYAMKQLTERGSTAVDWPMLYAAAIKVLGDCHGVAIISEFKGMVSGGYLIPFKLSKRVALAKDHLYESEIYKYVK